MGLLSKRVLHFDRKQVLWEYRAAQCYETFPEGLPTALLMSVKHRVRGVDLEVEGAYIRRLLQWSPEPELNAYEVWNSIVEVYTRADLTVREDKLVAIMGLAKYVQTLVKTRYYAGLSLKYFASQLLWWPVPSTYAQDAYIAPSWSWASWAGPVARPCWIEDLDSSGDRIHVQHIDIQTLTDDPFGPVVAGSVHISGTLIRGRLRYRTPDYEGYVAAHHLDSFGLGLNKVDYQATPAIEIDEDFLYVLHVKESEGILLQLTGRSLRQF